MLLLAFVKEEKGRMQAINKVRADFKKAACPTARVARLQRAPSPVAAAEFCTNSVRISSHAQSQYLYGLLKSSLLYPDFHLLTLKGFQPVP